MEKLKQAVNYFPVGLQPSPTTISATNEQLLAVQSKNRPSTHVRGKSSGVKSLHLRVLVKKYF